MWLFLRNNWFYIFLLIIFGFSVALLAIQYASTFPSFFPEKVSSDVLGRSNESDIRGQFGTLGDAFGGLLNPILTFITVILLIKTINETRKTNEVAFKTLDKTDDQIKQNEKALEQTKQALEQSERMLEATQKQLEFNNEELALTRTELAGAKEAQEEIAKTQQLQRFEYHFFSLLDQHNILLKRITDVRFEKGGERQHPVAFSVYEKCCVSVSPLKGREVNGSKDLYLLRARLVESRLLSQYFRVLYQVLRLIYEKCPREKLEEKELGISHCSAEEKSYSNIVRSMLSFEIFALLALNAFSDDERDQFYKYRLLVERYSFLEHLPLSLFKADGLSELICNAYKPSAFDQNGEYNKSQQNELA